MIRCREEFLFLVFVLSLAGTGFASGLNLARVRPLAVSAEARKEMAMYSLSAYENADPTNKVKALLFGGMTL